MATTRVVRLEMAARTSSEGCGVVGVDFALPLDIGNAVVKNGTICHVSRTNRIRCKNTAEKSLRSLRITTKSR